MSTHTCRSRGFDFPETTTRTWGTLTQISQIRIPTGRNAKRVVLRLIVHRLEERRLLVQPVLQSPPLPTALAKKHMSAPKNNCASTTRNEILPGDRASAPQCYESPRGASSERRPPRTSPRLHQQPPTKPAPVAAGDTSKSKAKKTNVQLPDELLYLNDLFKAKDHQGIKSAFVLLSRKPPPGSQESESLWKSRL
jgi:hypothetical protein